MPASLHPSEVKSISYDLEVSPSCKQKDSPVGKVDPYPDGPAIQKTSVKATSALKGGEMHRKGVHKPERKKKIHL
jgi:hypothetical protein